MIFRKIPATEEKFIQARTKYGVIYEEYREFAELLTEQAGNAKKKSGKSSSYARYLLRLVILYEENYQDSIGELDNFKDFKKIERLSSLSDFKEYNERENRFPSATIACFRAYVTSKQMMREESIDTELNSTLNSAFPIKGDIKTIENDTELITEPKRKPRKRQTQNGASYPRNSAESIAAKEKSNYKCEMDDRHVTFKTTNNQMPYMEAHHLIPMAAQDYYENTIDFADNIVTLCPNCHRKIHHGMPQEKAAMIDYLYQRHEEFYETYGIKINKQLLLNFYGIM
ncbi:HNH endonuclease [Solibacillus isronensis]|uniref:HNH endonuclease n=1 Tax=Solibacillus isronensis TaxID=412383 RepID=UPI00203C8FC4|nr:HNH endonuclease signature motif containing protein [Solibacillus isronensis]MCM3723972.1 HNH endonuclease [Solibacillus isronensis]